MTKQNLSAFTYSNRVQLIRGGRDFFRFLKSRIDEAQETIYFQFYIFDNDSTGKEIAESLKAAALRNVRVYMLLDAYASIGLTSAFVQELRDAGIRFTWFKNYFRNRKFFVGRRLHQKVVVIDGVKSFVCGLNVSDRYNDTPESIAWLDWALYTEGAASTKLEHVCKRRIRDFAAAPSRNEYHVEEKCAVRVCENDFISRKSEITKSYLHIIHEARSNVIIMSPYFMPGYRFRKALKAAVERGVRVQIILTGIADILIAKFAERYLYEWLFKYGIEIYEYQRNVLHGKIVVADQQRVSVGSYNVNNLSAYASIELNMEVKNEVFASDVEKRLMDIIQNECKLITSRNFKSNFFEKGLQVMSYNFMRMMLFLFAFRQHE